MPRPPIDLCLFAVATALLVLGACGSGGASNASATPRDPGVATVVKVVDGDTVRVRFPGRSGSESVRLIGIDTPETHGPGGLRECFGAEASARTSSLLPEGSLVRLERDVEARDRYARLLAYVYRRRDGLFVNLALARDGFAAPLSIPPNIAHATELTSATAAARDAGKGLWGRCGDADQPL